MPGDAGLVRHRGFQALVFSDYTRYRSRKPSWLGVLAMLPVHPGLIGSLVLRAQQCLFASGRVRAAWALRSLGNFLVGADFVPGADVGPAIYLVHPVGVVLGPGSRIGRDATLASGVVLGVRSHDEQLDNPEPDPYPVVGDGVFLGAHCVLLGGVHVGDGAMVGAGAVVTTDVAPKTVVAGNPARPVQARS